MDLDSDNSDTQIQERGIPTRAGEEFKEYIKYLKTFWGLLSGIIFVFPLSNILLKAIPVYGDESLHAILASLVSIFTILFIYSCRIEIAYGSPKSKRFISIITFISGLITLLYYRILIFENPPMPYFGYRNLALFEYCLIFGLWTMSFTLLAMSEYMRVNPKYILEYVIREDVIEDISEMTPDTRHNMAQKLLKIIEEEIENPEE